MLWSHCVLLLVSTNVSEWHAESIFRIEAIFIGKVTGWSGRDKKGNEGYERPIRARDGKGSIGPWRPTANRTPWKDYLLSDIDWIESFLFVLVRSNGNPCSVGLARDLRHSGWQIVLTITYSLMEQSSTKTAVTELVQFTAVHIGFPFCWIITTAGTAQSAQRLG
jgi:hypothetical protein